MISDYMISYEDRALREPNDWKWTMKKKPSIVEKATKGVQSKFNNMLPDKYHETITSSFVNNNLMKKLSETAIQAYRMRIFNGQ